MEKSAARGYDLCDPKTQKHPGKINHLRDAPLLGVPIMTTIPISLPDEMRAFVEFQMTQGGYATASDYFRSLIHEAQRRGARQTLETKFHEALESGPGPTHAPGRLDHASTSRG